MFLNFLSSLDSNLFQESDASDPTWSRVLIIFSAAMLCLTSLGIIIIFLVALKKNLKQVLGPTTVFSALAYISLAICWIYASNPSASKSPNLYVAFFTLLNIYACIFNKMGITWYFWRYLKDKTPVTLEGIRMNNEPSHIHHQEVQPIIGNDANLLMNEEEFPTVPKIIIEKHNSLVQTCIDIEKGYSRSQNNDKKIIQRLQKVENLIRGSPLSQINLIIIICVLIATSCVTVTYTFFQALGKGFFGDWSIEWNKTVQIPGIVVCVFTASIDLIISVLTFYYYKREEFPERAENLRTKEDLSVEEKQEKHYFSYLRPFIIVMTILNFLFLAANVYANKATKEATQDWDNVIWKVVYFLSPALQSFFLFLLKVTEHK